MYLVGRNKTAADTILGDCRKLCPKGDFRFVKAADLSLLQDVDHCCDEIAQCEAKEAAEGSGAARVDLLVATPGILNFGARQGTYEAQHHART